MLLLAGALLWFRAKSRQKAAVQFARIQEQEQGLNAVIQATEDERRRIARDLHDGVGQELSSLFLGIDSIKSKIPEALVPGLNSLRERLGTSTKHLRQISHQMMPQALETAGLAPALEDLVATSFRNTTITARVDAFRVPDNLDPKVALVCYRVAQELLNNVIRHAGASEIDVMLIAKNDRINLSVEDNGKGFDPHQASEGIGLTNMRTRLKAVNGSLEYEQVDGKGTRAVVNVKCIV